MTTQTNVSPLSTAQAKAIDAFVSVGKRLADAAKGMQPILIDVIKGLEGEEAGKALTAFCKLGYARIKDRGGSEEAVKKSLGCFSSTVSQFRKAMGLPRNRAEGAGRKAATGPESDAPTPVESTPYQRCAAALAILSDDLAKVGPSERGPLMDALREIVKAATKAK